MIHRIAVFVSWLSADPNRVRLILITLTLVSLLLGTLVPGLAALADGATGGGYNP